MAALPLLPILAVALLVAAPAAPRAAAQHAQLPRSALAVEAGGWQTWWRSRAAPRQWAAPHPAVAAALRWRTVRPGLETAELRLAGRGEAWRIRAIVLRLDPFAFEFRVQQATRAGGTLGAWSTASPSPEAVVALNAGQFSGGTPWGWVVRDGREMQPPGYGPLSMALVVDAAGRARLVAADSIPAVRARGGVAAALQSYPALLGEDGRVPAQLQGHGRGVDVAHRDARLAIGELRDGRLLIVLTRFEALGGALAALPFGLTTPEMAALMGALGSHQAMLLDGGLSGQLLLRGPAGEARHWAGLRRVPLGLELVPRAQAEACLSRGASPAAPEPPHLPRSCSGSPAHASRGTTSGGP